MLPRFRTLAQVRRLISDARPRSPVRPEAAWARTGPTVAQDGLLSPDRDEGYRAGRSQGHEGPLRVRCRSEGRPVLRSAGTAGTWVPSEKPGRRLRYACTRGVLGAGAVCRDDHRRAGGEFEFRADNPEADRGRQVEAGDDPFEGWRHEGVAVLLWGRGVNHRAGQPRHCPRECREAECGSGWSG